MPVKLSHVTGKIALSTRYDSCPLPVKISDFALSFFNDVFAKTYKEKNIIIQFTITFIVYLEILLKNTITLGSDSSA